MRRFHWPLQRLLDVTHQRERSQQAELLGVSRRIARLRQEVSVRRAGVRRLIAEISAMDFAERVRRHEEIMQCSDVHERAIRLLEGRLAGLAAERRAKAEAMVRVRKKREMLERLREEARQEHLREQLRAEQREFDESAHVGKARKLIRARADSAEREAKT